jgi:serine/threonine protein kinase
MDATYSTLSAGSSSIYVPQQVVYDGGGTTASTLPSWDGTRDGVAKHVPLSQGNALSTFTSLLNFLAISGIPILEADDISRHAPHDREIKRGASMQVFAGDYNGKAVALKYFRLSRRDSEQKYRESMYDLLFELKVMTHEPLCRHRNIVRAFGITFDPEIATIDNCSASDPDLVNPVVVVELADPAHPDLAELFRAVPRATFTFDVLAGLVADVADGIAILHEYGLTHSDIKPENILIFSEDGGRLTAKIGDFGAAGLDATKDKPRGVTWYWAAPESLQDCPLPALREMGFGKPHDVYAFGLVAGSIMLLGGRPLPDPEFPGQPASDIKYQDIADDVVYAAIESLWNQQSGVADSGAPGVLCKLETIHAMLEETLRLYPNARIESLDGIRTRLTGS